MNIGDDTSNKLHYGFIHDLWFALGKEEHKNFNQPNLTHNTNIEIGIEQISFSMHEEILGVFDSGTRISMIWK